MKKGTVVRIVNSEACFNGMIGVISDTFPKDVWDDKDVPEFMVDLAPIEDEYGELVNAEGLLFNLTELEVVI